MRSGAPRRKQPCDYSWCAAETPKPTPEELARIAAEDADIERRRAAVPLH
jgi:hypothetical protein